ncbi:MAG TPA: heavy metal-responsive transcriptional regulator [Longimicrobiales bacterium]|nr:heavy metal-responsive transcriptional regulator [Longimicrobiales bacterium]
MRIGELAEMAGVGVQTVRYYERRGLLPEPSREESGYRKYADGDLARLRFIVKAKSLGFTLSEIRDLLALRVDPGSTADDVRRRAQSKLDGVDARLRDLGRIRDALSRLVETCQAHGDAEECALLHALEDTAEP